MDPVLSTLEIERATAMTALNLAEAIIVGFEDMNNWMSSGLQTLTKEVGSSEALVLKEVFFEGDLEGMLHGAPMILTIDLEVFGKDLGKQEFAFKLDDPVFDAEQLVFIPLHMIYELFNQYVPSGLKKIIGPVLAKINEESQKVEEQVHAELSKIPSMNIKSLDDIKNSISFVNNKIILAQNDLNFKSTQFDFVNSNLILAQNSTSDDAKPKKSNVNNKSEKKSLTLKEKINNYKKKREKLLDNVILRNKVFGEAFRRIYK